MNPRDLDNLLDRINHLTQPEPATTPADDEDKPDEYGQPVSFHGAAPVGLLERIARWVRR